MWLVRSETRVMVALLDADPGDISVSYPGCSVTEATAQEVVEWVARQRDIQRMERLRAAVQAQLNRPPRSPEAPRVYAFTPLPPLPPVEE